MSVLRERAQALQLSLRNLLPLLRLLRYVEGVSVKHMTEGEIAAFREVMVRRGSSYYPPSIPARMVLTLVVDMQDSSINPLRLGIDAASALVTAENSANAPIPDDPLPVMVPVEVVKEVEKVVEKVVYPAPYEVKRRRERKSVG